MSGPRRIRIESFDALRGLAACSVVIGHCLLTLRGIAGPSWAAVHETMRTLGHTPLRILWNGHAAVVLFFVLSGFVLYLMLERGRLSVPAYAAKRVVRLYLPYIAAVAAGIAGQQLLYDGALAGLGDWINKFWTDAPTGPALAGHLFFLGAFDSSRYDFTIWTLVHEMRISLLFPLIFLLVQRLPWRRVLLLFALTSALMGATRIAAFHGYDALAWFARDGGYTAYAYTLHYLLAFAVGALLAAYRTAVGARYAALPGRTRALLIALALTLYIYGPRAMQITGTREMILLDWPLVLGAALLLVAAAFEPALARNLARAPLLYLGRVSYSLYLFHPIVLLAVLHAGNGRLDIGWLLAAALVGSFVVADLAYRLIERPAARAARHAGQRVQAATGARVPSAAAARGRLGIAG